MTIFQLRNALSFIIFIYFLVHKSSNICVSATVCAFDNTRERFLNIRVSYLIELDVACKDAGAVFQENRGNIPTQPCWARDQANFVTEVLTRVFPLGSE